MREQGADRRVPIVLTAFVFITAVITVFPVVTLLSLGDTLLAVLAPTAVGQERLLRDSVCLFK